MNFDEFTMIERKNRIKKKADILLHLASIIFISYYYVYLDMPKGRPKSGLRGWNTKENFRNIESLNLMKLTWWVTYDVWNWDYLISFEIGD